LFTGRPTCSACHTDFQQTTVLTGVNTGVLNLPPALPFDIGLDDGDRAFGIFNTPPLIEAADTAPLFHNNGAADIEAAVGFYSSDTFAQSPEGFFRNNLTTSEQGDVAAFLRVLNAAENVRQVRKRVQFVHDVRSSGNTDVLTIAIADTQDAMDVLNAKGL